MGWNIFAVAEDEDLLVRKMASKGLKDSLRCCKIHAWATTFCKAVNLCEDEADLLWLTCARVGGERLQLWADAARDSATFAPISEKQDFEKLVDFFDVCIECNATLEFSC